MTEQNLFQEIQEDLERQKLEAFWRKYGFWIIVAAIGMVVSTASSTAYHSWKADHNMRMTSEFLSASRALPDISKNIEALQNFSEKNKKEDVAALALLRAGALALQKNDKTTAIQAFDKIATVTDADLAFQQLGILLSVQAQLDSGNPAELSLRLEPLIYERAPWRFSAQEAQAYLSLRSGDTAKAKQIFTDLSQDVRAPQSMASRAADILRTLN